MLLIRDDGAIRLPEIGKTHALLKRFGNGLPELTARQVATPRPPTTQTTTCRVWAHCATQTYRLLALQRTNDHSSSSSRQTAFGSAGITRVCPSDVNVRAFFAPCRQGVAVYAERPGDAAHTWTFLIRPDNLFFTCLAIAEVWILSARLTTRSTLVLLLPVRRIAVPDQRVATTVVTPDVVAYHSPVYQLRLDHYRKE